MAAYTLWARGESRTLGAVGVGLLSKRLALEAVARTPKALAAACRPGTRDSLRSTTADEEVRVHGSPTPQLDGASSLESHGVREASLYLGGDVNFARSAL